MQRRAFCAGNPAIHASLVAAGATATTRKHVMFPDYEIFDQLTGSVVGDSCLVAGAPDTDEGLMELFDLANLLVDEDCLQLTIALPQSVKKMKKADRRVLTRMLSAIPPANMGNKLALVDAKGGGTPRYWKKGLKAKPRQRLGHWGTPALDLVGQQGPAIVISTAKYEYMAKEILALGGHAFCAGKVKYKHIDVRSPKGNREKMLLASRFDKKKLGDAEWDRLVEQDYHEPTDLVHPLAERQRFKKLKTDVEGRHVIIVGGTINDADTIDIYRMANAAYDAGALKITLVVPYFSYSTQERKTKPFEALKAKYRCRLLSSIPRCPMGNEIILVDLHSEAMPSCFENGLRVHHLYAGKVLVKALSDQGGDWRLLSADVGRSTWVKSMAKDANREWALAFKNRTGADTKAIGTLGIVEGKDGMMYDDMGRTLGSAGDAGEQYKEAGALELDLVLTHLPAPGESVAKLRARNIFNKVHVTNTHPRALQLAAEHPGYVTVFSITNIIVDQLLGRGPLNATTLS